MSLGKVAIEVCAGGTGTIKIDGVDIPGISGANIRIRAGQITRIHLLMAADTEIEVDGEIHTTAINGRVTKRKAT